MVMIGCLISSSGKLSPLIIMAAILSTELRDQNAQSLLETREMESPSAAGDVHKFVHDHQFGPLVAVFASISHPGKSSSSHPQEEDSA